MSNALILFLAFLFIAGFGAAVIRGQQRRGMIDAARTRQFVWVLGLSFAAVAAFAWWAGASA